MAEGDWEGIDVSAAQRDIAAGAAPAFVLFR